MDSLVTVPQGFNTRTHDETLSDTNCLFSACSAHTLNRTFRTRLWTQTTGDVTASADARALITLFRKLKPHFVFVFLFIIELREL